MNDLLLHCSIRRITSEQYEDYADSVGMDPFVFGPAGGGKMLYGAFLDGDPVGVATVSLFGSDSGPTHALIGDLHVLAAYRNSGIGTHLVSHIKTHLAALDVSVVADANEESLAIFTRAGFRDVGTFHKMLLSPAD
jgi:ribosomal protein S18 acetylase RimI-like enzyme